MTSLADALTQIAQAANLDASELIAYAAEDNVGGRDTGQFRAMSIFADEGRVLYALVRALKPELCIEIGVADGASATHILAALEVNQKGRLQSFDIDPGVGFAIPEELRSRWQLNIADALTADLGERADFVFEDSGHGLELSIGLFQKIKMLQPQVMVTHDVFTHEVYPGFYVKQALEQVFGEQAHCYKLDTAFTGIGLWFNESYRDRHQASEPDSVLPDTIPEATKPLVRKARRKATK